MSHPSPAPGVESQQATATVGEVQQSPALV
jgi:hypothetical protein